MPFPSLRISTTASLLAFAITFAGCSLLGPPGPTPEQRAEYLEPMLSAAGFHMIPADNQQKMQHLKNLPALKVNYYVDKEGKLHYWFADPDHCHCLYLGDEHTYQKYEALRLQARQAREQREAAEENYEAAQEMNMDMMAPVGVGFGYGMEVGF